MRSTVSLFRAWVDALYEQSTVLSMPPSLPQSNATVGGRGAENTVTFKAPCIKSVSRLEDGFGRTHGIKQCEYPVSSWDAF